MKVQGKTFVVTGGGSGIGRELVLLLLKRGASVASVDTNEAALKETRSLASQYTGKLSDHVADITDEGAIDKLPAKVIKAHGAVDAIINNAGIIQRFVMIKDLEVKEMKRVFDINFWGLVNVTKAFLPHLLKRPEAHIINTSSMGGYLPVPGQTVYGASKAAVKLFSEGLHSELMDTNVHVTTVFPGATATNIAVNSGATTRAEADKQKGQSKIKMTSAADSARIIVDGIEKNKYHVFAGSDANSMDKLSRLMPERAARIIYQNMRSILPK